MQPEYAEKLKPAGFFERTFKLFIENPILLKELQIGLREKKVFGIQVIYMITLGVVAFIFSVDLLNRHSYSDLGAVGRNYFIALCITQWFLVVLISPSLTSSSISSEREKKTLEMLLVSLLGAPEIIIGKLSYAVSYILMLLTSSLPLVALVFFLGGVSPHEIFINYLALTLWGILVSTMALFFSSRESKSASATNSAYGVVVIGGLFTAAVYISQIAETGLMLGFETKMPNIFMWLALYFNIIWAFLFFFYKTANNIRPKAKHILKLHLLFILGAIINTAGIMAVFAGASSTPSPNDSAAVLALISSLIFFFMGCFIERHRFASNREEAIMESSISTKKNFFPVFFFGLMITTCLLMLFQFPLESAKLIVTFTVFSVVFMALLVMTKESYFLTNGKIRPVIIFYGYLLLINIIPLISWIITDAVHRGSGNTSISALSLIYVQPVLSITSIWDSSSNFGPVDFLGTNIPTFYFTVMFYLFIMAGIKALNMFVSSARKNISPSILPPPGSQVKP